MPKLILTRDHPQDIAHRYAIMSVDGEEVVRLKYKQSFTVEVEPGPHTVRGKNELGKAEEIEIEVKDKDVTVHIGGVPRGCFALLMWLAPPAPTIIMQVDKPWDVPERQ